MPSTTRRPLLLLAVVLANAAPAAAAPATMTDVILVNHRSGACAAVSGPSRTPGTALVQWTCWESSGQTFDAVAVDGGYRIKDRYSGLCLSVAARSKKPGTAATVETCGSTPFQTWSPTAAGGGAVRLANGGSGLCLAVVGGGTADGDRLVQTACRKVPTQAWTMSAKTVKSWWSPVYKTPIPAVASTVLANGKVLLWSARNPFMFGYGEIGRTYTSIFDPATGKASERIVSTTNHEMFCPGIATLPDGRVLVNGGSSSSATSLYDPRTNAWATGQAMNVPRGYEADTVLDTGDVFTLGGSWSGDLGHRMGEVWDAAGGWRVLKAVDGNTFAGPDPRGIYRGDNHMWLFGVTGGKVFHAGPAAAMHWIDTAGDGAVHPAGTRGDDRYSINGDVVMWKPGVLLKVGGAPGYESGRGTTAAYSVDFSAGYRKPVVVKKLKPMLFPRTFANAVVLPDGAVVIVGGRTDASTTGDTGSVMIPEIWDPKTATFSRLTPMVTPRHYHSSAVLLPDGRVFVGGGGVCGTCVNHPDAEILTPPYLIADSGALAPRPVITKAPRSAKVGATLAVTTDTDVKGFALVRMGASTHTVNNDQRRIPLVWSRKTGNAYTLPLPASRGVLLPGNWMLFALDAAGVPSVARIVNIR